MWRREAWRASQWFLLAACGLGISGGRDANTLPGRHTWSPRAAGWGMQPPRVTRRGAGSVCALRGGHETGQLDEGGETQTEGVLGKRQREDAVGEGVSNVGTAGDSKQMPKLTLLLQRAAAYSAFLRERLQQSRLVLNATSTASASAAAAAALAAAGNATLDPRQPKLVTGAVLRSYQVDGVQWLISLYENGLNGILADEMGLGKTLQVISFFAHLWEKKVKGPFLVVAPLSTVTNWVKEFERFAPDVPVLLYHGTKQERAAMRRRELRIVHGKWTKNKAGQALPVVVTSFEIALNDARMLAAVHWKYLTVDEGHRLKNKDSKLLRELKALRAGNRLLLTGTPLQNNLVELWALLNFILPDIFDSLETFQGWFDFDEHLVQAKNDQGLGAAKILMQEQESRLVSKLHAILDPFVLRRLKNDVVLELPDKHVYVLFASLTHQQLRINKAIKENTLYKLFEASPSNGDAGASLDARGETMVNTNAQQSSLSNLMIQARKNCNHPFLFQAPMDSDGHWVLDERLVDQSGKMQLLDRMLKVLRPKGHKVLVFFQMTRMMDIVEDYLEELRGWRCCRIDGGVPMAQRQEQMQLFESDPDIFVFLLSTRSGGQGISLPAADTVIIYDSDFNPQQDLQAMDRCHRIGQKKEVGVYRLVSRDSVEQLILERSVKKRKLELMTMSRHRFKAHQKMQGETDVSSTLLAGSVDVEQTLSAAELQKLLAVDVVPSKAAQDISDADLHSLLLQRGAAAPVGNGAGWEIVDAETSSFVRQNTQSAPET